MENYIITQGTCGFRMYYIINTDRKSYENNSITKDTIIKYLYFVQYYHTTDKKIYRLKRSSSNKPNFFYITKFFSNKTNESNILYNNIFFKHLKRKHNTHIDTDIDFLEYNDINELDINIRINMMNYFYIYTLI